MLIRPSSPASRAARLLVLLLVGVGAGACIEDLFFPEDESDQPAAEAAGDRAGARSEPAPDAGAKAAAEPEAGAAKLAFAGHTPEAVAPPAAGEAFVEPPLERRPRRLHLVVAGAAARPEALQSAADALAGLEPVPIGYPAVDQAPGGAAGFVLLAGKFARRDWADALVAALKRAGWEELRVVARRYRFDRRKPALNGDDGPRAGRVFAGMAGVAVPLLAKAGEGAAGTGVELADGALLRVLGEQRVGKVLWYRVARDEQAGFLPAGRVLVEANVFPAPGGRRAVLGVDLGCHESHCRWDYWLVGRGLQPRRLLKAAGERMPHDFSPDGRWLAYTTFDPSILVIETEGERRLELGPGISPSFSPDGRRLYLRGPGVRGARDDVRISPVAGWTADGDGQDEAPVEQLYDLRGTPFYPRRIATVPPPVDFVDNGLFTLFYRLGEKSGRKQIQRWGVLFTPAGKVLNKAGVAISD
jgi:hypothetical protein